MGRRKKFRVIKGGAEPVQSSDPTPQRLLRSGGYFEEGHGRNGAITLTFVDDGLGRAYRDGLITLEQRQIGERFHRIWYEAGLAGHVPTITGNESTYSAIDGDNFGGMPRTESESNKRVLYRQGVRRMGILCARVVERVACYGQRVEVVDITCPGAEKLLRRGLSRLLEGI